MDKRPMTLEECCEFLQVSENTVRSLVKAGMPHYRAGVGLRFDANEVLAWAREQARLRDGQHGPDQAGKVGQ